MTNKYISDVNKNILNNLKPHILFDDTSKYIDGVILMIDEMVEVTIQLKSDSWQDYDSIDTSLPVFPIVTIFEENSPYITKYANLVEKLLENGIDIKWKRKILFDNERIKNNKSLRSMKLGDENNEKSLILTLATVILTGSFLAVFIFICELLYCVYLKKCKKLCYNEEVSRKKCSIKMISKKEKFQFCS